jgi:hypothetical protein
VTAGKADPEVLPPPAEPPTSDPDDEAAQDE